jgi:ATP-binding cassette subfamily B protein
MMLGTGGGGQGLGRIDYEGQDARAASRERASVRRVISYFVPYWPLALGIFASMLVGAGLGILPPLLMKAAIDDAMPRGDLASLTWLAGGMIGAGILAGLVQVLQNWLNLKIGQSVMYDIRNLLYRRVQAMSIAFFTATRTGEVMSRLLNDVNGVQEVVTRSLMNIANNLFVVVAVVVAMVSINWKLTVVALIVLPLFILPVRTAGRMRSRIARQTQGKLAEISGRIQESLGINGILLMKVFGRQPLESERFRRANHELMELQVRQGLVGRWFQMFVGLFGTVSPAVIVWYGGWEVVNGNLSVGGLVAFTAYIARLYTPISQLVNVQIDILASLGLFERIFEYLDLEPEVVERPGAIRPPAAEGRVRFDGVWFTYGGDRWALQDVSFEAQPGQLVALVGPSGAGKSTMTYLVPRLYDPARGTVSIDGHDLRDVELGWLADQIGMVPQETFLFHTTVRDNLLYGDPDASEDRMIEAARAANIHDLVAALPDAYETVVGERGFRLSGGERQRIAIARAILKDPRIIILDEATSSLDSRSERLVQEALERLMRGRTSVVIAHRLSTILSADRILVIDHGRIVQAGTHAELLGQGGLYAELHREQFEKRSPLEASSEAEAPAQPEAATVAVGDADSMETAGPAPQRGGGGRGMGGGFGGGQGGGRGRGTGGFGGGRGPQR